MNRSMAVGCALAVASVTSLGGQASSGDKTVWQRDVRGAAVAVVARPFNDVGEVAYYVQIKPLGSRQTKETRLQHVLGALQSISVWDERRLVIVGRDVGSVIDLPTATLEDQFFGADFALSPSGRFVAYTGVQPRTRDDSASATYVVYDVSLTARGQSHENDWLRSPRGVRGRHRGISQ